MLFADMVGFCKLNEEDTPAFIVHFLGEIARVIKESDVKPAFWNTWGDGLFLVLDQVEQAAYFAMRLRDMVQSTDWVSHGLPSETSIRIGMHTGPVLPAQDPIIDRDNFFGSHVNLAARIEPIAAAGSVYVSEQTASLLALSGSKEYVCDYLGISDLAKQFDTAALYRLRRIGEFE